MTRACVEYTGSVKSVGLEWGGSQAGRVSMIFSLDVAVGSIERRRGTEMLHAEVCARQFQPYHFIGNRNSVRQAVGSVEGGGLDP